MILNQFEPWQAAVIADLDPDTRIKCPHCDGYGETTCNECDCSKTCTECDGDCELRAGDMSDDELRKAFNRDAYHRACIEDLVRVANLRNEAEYITLASHGYDCYTLVRHRRLEVKCPDGQRIGLPALKPNEIRWARGASA